MSSPTHQAKSSRIRQPKLQRRQPNSRHTTIQRTFSPKNWKMRITKILSHRKSSEKFMAIAGLHPCGPPPNLTKDTIRGICTRELPATMATGLIRNLRKILRTSIRHSLKIYLSRKFRRKATFLSWRKSLSSPRRPTLLSQRRKKKA